MKKKKDSTTASVLFKAITEQKWAFAIQQTETYPDDTKTQAWVKVEKATTSLYPLHLACTKNPTEEIIAALLKCFPEAIAKSDDIFNRLPIHFACLNRAHESVVRALLKAHPVGASRVAMNGGLPVHYGVASGTSTEVLAALIEYYPQGARIADKRGMLPLHLAILQNASPHVVVMLLKAFPEGVYFKTLKGNSPKACLQDIPDSPEKKTILALLDVSTKKCSRFHAAINASVRGGNNQFTRYMKMITAVESAEFC